MAIGWALEADTGGGGGVETESVTTQLSDLLWGLRGHPLYTKFTRSKAENQVGHPLDETLYPARGGLHPLFTPTHENVYKR